MQSQSDDESDDDVEVKYLGKDGIIFVIDATAKMFMEDEFGESPFRMCLKACDLAMQDKIMHSNSDIISVVIFGTEACKNDSNLKNIYVLQELQRPSASAVKQLREMHESRSFDGFLEKYGHNEDYLFADVLWLVHAMYSKNTTKLATKRILLLTCSEILGKNDSHSKRQAVARAKDLRGDFISFDVIPCCIDYHPSEFLQTVMGIIEGLSGLWNMPQSHCIGSLEDIPKVVKTIASTKDQRSRCLGHIPFKIGEGVVVNVELYNLVQQIPLPQKTRLERIANDIIRPTVIHYKRTTTEVPIDPESDTSDGDVDLQVKSKQTTTEMSLCPEAVASCDIAGEQTTLKEGSKEMLMRYDLAKYVEVGGERTKFTQDELKAMKSVLGPGLVLLGFIPISLLKKTYHCSPSSFIYLDKSSTPGAKDLFSALWLRSGTKDVAAICSYSLRAGTFPHFVALTPAGMEDNEIRSLYQKYSIHTSPDPQGFHLFLLPFTDNINSLGLLEKPSAYPNQVDRAIAMLKKLRIVFHPSLFPNPVLDTHWAAIEAIALDRPAVSEVIDKIKPNHTEMDERLGELADEFLASVYQDGYDPTIKPSKSSGRKAGKSNLSEFDLDVVHAAIRSKKVDNLTVDVLKSYLKTKGRPVSGRRKADLVAEVYNLDD